MEWSSLKSAGNDSYREGRVAEAESLYSQSITALQGAEAGCGDAKQRSELALERATVLVNRALARFQLGNLVDCIADCDDALRIDPGRVKALFRRAQALEAQGEFARAFKDLNLVLSLEKGNKAAVEAARRVTVAIQAAARDPSRLAAEALKMLSSDGSGSSGSSGAADMDAKLGRILARVRDSAEFSAQFIASGGLGELVKAAETSSTALFVLNALIDRPTGLLAVASLLPSLITLVTSLDPGSPSATATIELLGEVVLKADEGEGVPREHTRDVLLCYKAVLDVVRGATVTPPPTDAQLSSLAALQVLAKLSCRARLARAMADLGVVHSVVRRCNDEREDLRQASSLCITQVLKTISSEPILRSLPKPEQRKAMEERSARVKRLITDLCSAAIHTPGDEERVALRSEDVERATVVARAVFLIDRDLGLWLMEQEGVVSAICSLSFSSSATAQSLCASILSDLAGDEKGRSLINSEVRNALSRLLDSRTASVKSGSAVTLAKLSTSAKGSDPMNEGDLVRSVYGLVTSAAERLKAGESGAAEVAARAVEALSCLTVQTDVKNDLALRHTEVLSGLSSIVSSLLALAEKGTSVAVAPMLLGISSVYANVSMSVTAMQETKLRELDVSREQWEEFQRLTMSATGAAEERERDPPADVEARMFGLLGVNVISTLSSIALCVEKFNENAVSAATIAAAGSDPAATAPKRKEDFPGALALEAVSTTLLNLACEPKARGRIVQSRGVGMCITLSRRNSAKGRPKAEQALAKVIITTNPSLIPEPQLMDVIGPLVDLLNTGDALQQFEGCLALTNLSSLGPTIQSKIIAEKGLGALESCQFSENKMVRRAATEALANMSTTEAGSKLISEKRCKLWLALAREYSDKDEFETARAACGALAMVCSDLECAERVASQGGVAALMQAMFSCNAELQHRAIVAIAAMSETEAGRAALEAPLAPEEEAAAETKADDSEEEEEEGKGPAHMTGRSVLTLLAGGMDVFAMSAARRKEDGEPFPPRTPGLLPVVRDTAKEIVKMWAK